MDKTFLQLKEELTQILIEETNLQEQKKEIENRKGIILDKLLPHIKADTYSGDCFMLRKDYNVDYKIEDPELKDYLKERDTVLDLPRVKRAIKSGIVFTNVKVIPKLIAYKKKNGLKEVSGLQKDLS